MSNKTKYTATIRRNADGKIVTHASEWDVETDNVEGDLRFMWTEGNYSCDCNLHLFFCRAIGTLGENEFDDIACGEEAYNVISLVLEDGTVVI